ncbi:MAG: gluconokinase [Chloroflexota bacterium]|nr:gluconokinase [Chloroflexota bacterium]
MPATSASVGRRSARAPLVLAIDVGSSSTRAMVFDATATAVSGASGSVRYVFETRPAGAATLHADRLLSLIGSCTDAAIARRGARAPEIAAVGVSVFWHSLMGLDARDRPTTPVLTWADTRARDAARSLAGELDRDAVHARTGCYLHASYPPAKLRWLRDSEPGIFSRTVRWCSFAEYLGLRLTGERRCAHGMASASGMYDQARRAWDPSLLDALGLPLHALFPISDEALALSPSRVKRWPALRRAAVMPGIGDGALANVGSGCVTEDRAALSLGTSGAVRVCSAAARAPAPPGLWEYRLDERHSVVGGAVSNGGNVIDWARRTLRRTEASASPGERALELTALPRLSGERSLSWDDRATGVIGGLRLSHTAGDISEALILGMCLRLARVIDALVEARPSVREILASGGVLRTRRDLAQVIADAVGRPIAIAVETEASARGAALVALARIGARASLEAPVRIARRLRPVAERGERYRELGRRQDRLEDALRGARLV